MTRFVVTASPVDDLDSWPPLHTLYVEAASTSDAVELATRLLHTKSPGLAVRSVVRRGETQRSGALTVTRDDELVFDAATQSTDEAELDRIFDRLAQRGNVDRRDATQSESLHSEATNEETTR